MRSSTIQRAENAAQGPTIDRRIDAHQHATWQHDLDQPIRS
jgi:hypothetical protein